MTELGMKDSRRLNRTKGISAPVPEGYTNVNPNFYKNRTKGIIKPEAPAPVPAPVPVNTTDIQKAIKKGAKGHKMTAPKAPTMKRAALR